MSRSEDEIATLRESRQHLVFASDADRECTVQCIENTFSLNEFGKERIRCLLDNRLDRELIGHLIAMMSYNIASLQKKNVELVQTNAELERKREEDEAAVQRLTALGFPREMAAEAYLACERNEMLAANFLMDHQ